MSNKSHYLVGQRLILSKREIVTKINDYGKREKDDEHVCWVKLIDGTELKVGHCNLKPLPNGQL